MDEGLRLCSALVGYRGNAVESKEEKSVTFHLPRPSSWGQLKRSRR